jgi:hypothetical protein
MAGEFSHSPDGRVGLVPRLLGLSVEELGELLSSWGEMSDEDILTLLEE